jgi:SAM-dependent methyltransferase
MIKLNIGAGPNMFPFDGWINYDREDFAGWLKWIEVTTFADYLQNIANYVRGGGKVVSIQQDLRDNFPQHKDNSTDLIYCGQAIEHLNYVYEIPKFLKECFRMLKSGGVLRMTTPDLDLLLNAYLSGEMNKFAIEQPEIYKSLDPSAQLAMLMYGASGENCKWDHYEGHFFLYTQKSMTKVLNDAGFGNIQFYYEKGKSHSSVMAKECVDMGMTHSFIVEAVK